MSDDKSALCFLLRSSRKVAGSHVGKQHEVDKLQAEPSAANNTSPLTWWQLNGHRFPGLQQVTLVVLAVPARSTPVERQFSVARLVFTKKRARLSADHIDMLFFLHQNRCALESLSLGSELQDGKQVAANTLLSDFAALCHVY